MDLVEINATNLKLTLMKMQSLTDEFSDKEGVRSRSKQTAERTVSCTTTENSNTFEILSYKFHEIPGPIYSGK